MIYSNGTGIVDQRYYGTTAVLIANNLIYANTTAAISITGQSGVSIVNNTIDQPIGDGIDISGSNSGTQLRNNIFVIGSGIGINVAANSENGFASDYNLFYLPARAWSAAAPVRSANGKACCSCRCSPGRRRPAPIPTASPPIRSS